MTEDAEASTRTNWKQPLKELSENTGGFAVLDTNDYKKPMERLAADLGGYYEVAYAPSVAAWDGAFRSTEVKVSRGGTKVQDRNGYFATPPDECRPGARLRDAAARGPQVAAGAARTSRSRPARSRSARAPRDAR